MWKLLQRQTPLLIAPQPTEPSLGLRALVRFLHRARRNRTRPSGAGALKSDLARRSAAELAASTSSGETRRLRGPGDYASYASNLRLLKAQHAALSADRSQFDQADERQRERLADLEARLHFILGTPPPSPSAVGPGSVDGFVPPAPTAPVSAEAYHKALQAAQHWQTLAEALKRELHSVSELVRVDSLTGLHNRRAFDEHLPREVARSQRLGEPFCLLMIDIDHFKRLNDTCGHPAGDAVLRSVAHAIAGCTRPSDLVARYGGEEFAVVLSGVDSGQALAVAERIRRQVARAETGSHRVTVSVGVAQYRPAGGDDAEQLLVRADQAMYAAKHGGRNRVQVASRAT